MSNPDNNEHEVSGDSFAVNYGGGVFRTMQREVSQWCRSKGWEPDPDRTFGDECALLHSEVSEALEAYRDWKFDRMEKFEGEIQPVGLSYTKWAKPEGVPSEFADILIRLLHYSHVHGIDLFGEYRAKMDYNETRAWRHGGRNL